uniref:RanBD1 domain-containing protein n=1 Tax=Steinernema glaseri TaxID=37863 RepID=A0A1I7Z9P1_9BILA
MLHLQSSAFRMAPGQVFGSNERSAISKIAANMQHTNCSLVGIKQLTEENKVMKMTLRELSKQMETAGQLMKNCLDEIKLVRSEIQEVKGRISPPEESAMQVQRDPAEPTANQSGARQNTGGTAVYTQSTAVAPQDHKKEDAEDYQARLADRMTTIEARLRRRQLVSPGTSGETVDTENSPSSDSDFSVVTANFRNFPLSNSFRSDFEGSSPLQRSEVTPKRMQHQGEQDEVLASAASKIYHPQKENDNMIGMYTFEVVVNGGKRFVVLRTKNTALRYEITAMDQMQVQKDKKTNVGFTYENGQVTRLARFRNAEQAANIMAAFNSPA